MQDVYIQILVVIVLRLDTTTVLQCFGCQASCVLFFAAVYLGSYHMWTECA